MTNDPLQEIAESVIRSYSFQEGTTIKPKKISYGDYNLRNFSFREVYVDDSLSGEYHIKLHNNSSIYVTKALIFFSQHLPSTCELGMIDIQNHLRLEFQIYIKTSDLLLIPSMMATMETLDKPFGECC
jgi:hypothetical protein